MAHDALKLLCVRPEKLVIGRKIFHLIGVDYHVPDSFRQKLSLKVYKSLLSLLVKRLNQNRWTRIWNLIFGYHVRVRLRCLRQQLLTLRRKHLFVVFDYLLFFSRLRRQCLLLFFILILFCFHILLPFALLLHFSILPVFFSICPVLQNWLKLTCFLLASALPRRLRRIQIGNINFQIDFFQRLPHDCLLLDFRTQLCLTLLLCYFLSGEFFDLLHVFLFTAATSHFVVNICLFINNAN